VFTNAVDARRQLRSPPTWVYLTAEAPNRRRAVYFTYVTTWASSVQRRLRRRHVLRSVVGRSAARHKYTDLVLGAVEDGLRHDHEGHPTQLRLIIHAPSSPRIGEARVDFTQTVHLRQSSDVVAAEVADLTLDPALLVSAAQARLAVEGSEAFPTWLVGLVVGLTDG
jgi:putative transposase